MVTFVTPKSSARRPDFQFEHSATVWPSVYVHAGNPPSHVQVPQLVQLTTKRLVLNTVTRVREADKGTATSQRRSKPGKRQQACRAKPAFSALEQLSF